jgi:hypothetical protein
VAPAIEPCDCYGCRFTQAIDQALATNEPVDFEGLRILPDVSIVEAAANRVEVPDDPYSERSSDHRTVYVVGTPQQAATRNSRRW